MTRVVYDSELLKLVATKDRQEVSGLVCDREFATCFGMWYTLLLGRLTGLDVDALQSEYPDYFWGSWLDVLHTLRARLDGISEPELNHHIVQMLTHIPSSAVADEVRTVLGANPFKIFGMLNGDIDPVTRGKAVLGHLWFVCGVYRWTATLEGKQPVWSGKLSDDGVPSPGPFTVKSLEHYHTSAKSTFKVPPAMALIHASAAPIPTVDPQVSAADGLASEVHPRSFAEILNRAIELAGELPPEFVPKAVAHLNTQLVSVASLKRLLPFILSIRDPEQLVATLSTHIWPTGSEAISVQLGFQRWNTFVEDAGLINATPSMQQRFLADILALIPPEVSSWRTLAAKLATRLLASLNTDGAPDVQALLLVDDHATFARTLTDLVVASTHRSFLKALKAQLQDLGNAPVSTPDWAERLLSNHLAPSATATPEPRLPGPPSGPSSGRVGVSLRVVGGISLPWLALQTALAAHLGDDVFVGRQFKPMVSTVYASVGSEAWSAAAAGRTSWQIPLGTGLVGTVDSLRADGLPLLVPRFPESPTTFASHLRDGPAPRSSLSGKRPRSTSPPAGSSRGTSNPWPPSRTRAASSLPAQPPPVLRIPTHNVPPRALLGPARRAWRGPGQL